ncbi:hypothetical protein OQZ33_04355 [Pedobacter sp. MC2016-05]|uniref:hypothetical protein n=1 Tax=Pedobacter sp. MC2016-05 TaxID=2994474 RepID=UPI0022483F03|nr:hypothetical protein [Pedobacter sp. MC2016-05]MCX2473558.1 hypothetical protein [Pedobacter sp. MC2016-05]
MKNLINIFKFALFLGMAYTVGGPMMVGLTVVALMVAIAFGKPNTALTGVHRADVSPDVSKIQTYIGKVKKGIYSKLVNSMDIMKDITMVPNVKNTYITTELVIKNGPKPYTGVFNPVGNDIDYEPHTYTVQPFQRDLIIDPRKYRTSHLAYERGPGESSKSNTIPFEQYTIKAILENDAAILNDQTAWSGLGKAAFNAFNAGTVYNAGARIKFTLNNEVQYFFALATTVAGESPLTTPLKWADANALAICEGLGTIIKAGRDSGDITNIISSAGKSEYELFKAVFRKHSDARKALGVQIYSGSARMEALMDDFENKVGKYTENDGSGKIYLANTNKKAELVSATWMSKTNMILSGPRLNFLGLTDEVSDFNTVNVIPDVYTLKMGVAGVLGFGYQDGREIVITDQD